MGDFHDGVPLWLRNLIADVRVTLYEDDCDCDQLDINDYFCLTCSLYRCTICSGVSADCLAAGHVSILIQRQNRMKVVQYMEVSDHVNCSAVRRYPHGENNERVLVVRRKGLPLAPRNGTSIPCAYSRCDYYFSGLPDPHDQYANPRRLYCSLSCMVRSDELSDNSSPFISKGRRQETISSVRCGHSHNISSVRCGQQLVRAQAVVQRDALDAKEVGVRYKLQALQHVVCIVCVSKSGKDGTIDSERLNHIVRRGPATPPSPLPEVAAANDDNYGSDVKHFKFTVTACGTTMIFFWIRMALYPDSCGSNCKDPGRSQKAEYTYPQLGAEMV
ncbi:hypothetical protein AKJ16_DCAP06461 [Drosera capensis]